MNVAFLGQGFEPESINSVGNTLIKLFKDDRFNSFCGISAFASVSAANILSQCINDASESFQNFTVIVGVDQEGTSKEALETINNLGINSYIFYQKESPIFHPKIYIFEGENHSALIVGSSNLTGAGLFRNIESSLYVEFENTEAEGRKLINELKTYFNTLFDFSDSNLFALSDELINNFIQEGIVPTQSEWKNKYKKNTPEKTSQESSGLNIPKRKTAKIPKVFRNSSSTQVNNIVTELVEELEISTEELSTEDSLQLLWESNPLTERDLNIPTGQNTNPTGSMLFKKGKTANIDQRHYFRENVFSDLNWTFDTRANKTHLERAVCSFRIVINGENQGVYELNLTHNPRTDTLAYAQNNSMTQISWGSIKNLIRNRDLIGKTLYLLKNQETNEFVIDIK